MIQMGDILYLLKNKKTFLFDALSLGNHETDILERILVAFIKI